MRSSSRKILEQRRPKGDMAAVFKYLKGHPACGIGSGLLSESPEGKKVAGFKTLKAGIMYWLPGEV